MLHSTNPTSTSPLLSGDQRHVPKDESWTTRDFLGLASWRKEEFIVWFAATLFGTSAELLCGREYGKIV